MKQLICELCGSTKLTKQGGEFVCQGCGARYSVEEAKQLMREVEGAPAQESKYLALARRAREEDNTANAEKYYGLLLEEEPDNWEAAFFQVYYQAKGCVIGQIANASLSLRSAIQTALRLIAQNVPEGERKAALTEVVTYSDTLLGMMKSAATNHYLKFSDADGSRAEYATRTVAVEQAYEALEAGIKERFPDQRELLCQIQKTLDKYIRSNAMNESGHGYNETAFRQLAGRLEKEIREFDPGYTPFERPKTGGCYIATAVYGSYDCPQVWTLRRFRDGCLARSWYGRAFVRAYYAVSPTLVRYFGGMKWFEQFWRGRLDRMVEGLRRRGYDSTPYDDKQW